MRRPNEAAWPVRRPGRNASRGQNVPTWLGPRDNPAPSLVPTLAELTGAEAPDDIDGVSFLPTLTGTPAQAEHEALYWEYHGLWDGAQAVRMGDWKGVRLGGHLDANAPIELYDLAADRGETSDVAGGNPEVVARIRAVMESRTPSQIPRWNFPVEPPDN